MLAGAAKHLSNSGGTASAVGAAWARRAHLPGSPMHDPSLSPTSPRASSRAGERARLAGVAQLVEHLLCKQVVGGSSPPASSYRRISEGCPSGQREQAVNLPAHAYVGSNPTPSTCNVGYLLRDGAALLVLRESAGLRPRSHLFFGVRQASGAPRPSQPAHRPRRVRRFVVGSAVARADRDLVFQDFQGDPGAACAAPRVVGTNRGTRSAACLRDLRGLASLGPCDFAGVAQLVERQPSKLNVEGSSPFSRSAGGHAHLAQLVEHVLGKDEVTSSILVVGSNVATGKGLNNPKGVGK